MEDWFLVRFLDISKVHNMNRSFVNSKEEMKDIDPGEALPGRRRSQCYLDLMNVCMDLRRCCLNVSIAGH